MEGDEELSTAPPTTTTTAERRGRAKDARRGVGTTTREAPSTPPARRGRTAGMSRLCSCDGWRVEASGPWTVPTAGSSQGSTIGRRRIEGAADKIDAGAEANEELAERFAREYRSTQPFLTRRVAETWMTRSALGRRRSRRGKPETPARPR